MLVTCEKRGNNLEGIASVEVDPSNSLASMGSGGGNNLLEPLPYSQFLPTVYFEHGQVFVADLPLFGVHVTDTTSVVLTVLSLLIVVAVARLIFHYFELRMLPESSLVIILGIVFGGILMAFGLQNSRVFAFEVDLFLIFLVPWIILDAGYFLQKDFFFANLGLILSYAVLGTLLNTVLVGTTVWLCTLPFLDSYDQFTIIDALLFGSLISAVDPVAVIAIFESTHVNETLNMLVFGESVLNDAVSIVLYRTFYAMRDIPTSEFTPYLPAVGITKFAIVSIGGVMVGVTCALSCSWLTKYTYHLPLLEPLLVLTFSYLSYMLAETLTLSGIMAILFCGMVMSRYVEGNINRKSHTTLKYTLKMAASTAETLVFVYLGTTTTVLLFEKERDNKPYFEPAFVISAFVSMQMYRFFIVLILTAIGNRGRLKHERIGFRDQFVLYYGGLRGAIAFALAYILPDDMYYKQVILVTTLIIVLFTIFVQGSTIKPILKLIRIRLQREEQLPLHQQVLPRVVEHIHDAIMVISGAQQGFVGWKHYWHLVDHVLQFLFVRQLLTEEKQLLKALNRLKQMQLEGADDNSLMSDEQRERMVRLNAMLPALLENPQVNLSRVIQENATTTSTSGGGGRPQNYGGSAIPPSDSATDLRQNAEASSSNYRMSMGEIKRKHPGSITIRAMAHNELRSSGSKLSLDGLDDGEGGHIKRTPSQTHLNDHLGIRRRKAGNHSRSHIHGHHGHHGHNEILRLPVQDSVKAFHVGGWHHQHSTSQLNIDAILESSVSTLALSTSTMEGGGRQSNDNDNENENARRDESSFAFHLDASFVGERSISTVESEPSESQAVPPLSTGGSSNASPLITGIDPMLQTPGSHGSHGSHGSGGGGVDASTPQPLSATAAAPSSTGPVTPPQVTPLPMLRKGSVVSDEALQAVMDKWSVSSKKANRLNMAGAFQYPVSSNERHATMMKTNISISQALIHNQLHQAVSPSKAAVAPNTNSASGPSSVVTSPSTQTSPATSANVSPALRPKGPAGSFGVHAPPKGTFQLPLAADRHNRMRRNSADGMEMGVAEHSAHMLHTLDGASVQDTHGILVYHGQNAEAETMPPSHPPLHSRGVDFGLEMAHVSVDLPGTDSDESDNGSEDMSNVAVQIPPRHMMARQTTLPPRIFKAGRDIDPDILDPRRGSK
jgi:sodium/hydrogen exchanger 3